MTQRLWLAFQDGGWMMWFIFIFGLLGLSAAGRFAWRGEHQLVAFIRSMAITILAAGSLGFFVGMTAVLTYVVYQAKADERLVILLLGTKEALSNVTASLIFFVLLCLLTAVGHRRFPLPNPSAVPR
jgi:hypothetical protein